MKFNDGYWLLKDGVKPAYGFQITKAATVDSGKALELLVATAPINHRGDTLKGPSLTVKLHSPIENVVGVKIEHFKGVKPVSPQIPLFPTESKPPKLPDVKITTETPTFTTGALTVTATHRPYSLTFSVPNHPTTLTVAHPKGQAVVDVPYKWTTASASETSCLATNISATPFPIVPPATVRYIVSELNLSPGELVYGFGEQFRSFVKNGQTVSIWNQDGGTASEQSYKCVPFYITNRNYGVFINHPGEVEVEVGSEKASRVCTSVKGESLEYYLIYGATPLEILSKYTLLTGRPSLPPSWTFGLWLSTSFLTDYDAKTVSGFLEGMQERNCGVRVFHFDCFWMKQYEWCSFTFDPDNFPDPKAYLSEIKKKYGVKICLWINPYISQHSPIFDEAAAGGYLIKRTNGDVWQWDLWQPGLAVVDVTNPEARKWYAGKLAALLDLGVDCFKTDFAERIPHVAVKFNSGDDASTVHNMYTIIYNQLVFELLEKRFGKGEAVVFARSSFAGGQRFPVHWGGDCESTFEAMAETLRGGLSLTLSGFAFTSHDIGGFEGHPPPEIYLRWVGYGLFSSHSRLHGSGSYRVPWNYGEDASKVLAKFLDTKHRLMPYLYYQAIQAHIHGYPIQRATWLDFPNDRTTHTLDSQYMLGPSLLFAPVFANDSTPTEYYLPEGKWTAFFPSSHGPVVQGPKWVREANGVPYDVVPAWVRPGSVLLLGPSGKGIPDYALAEEVEVRVYELEETHGDVSVGVPSGKGSEIVATVSARRVGKEVKVAVVDGKLKKDWSIRFFADGVKVEGVTGGQLSAAGSNEGGVKVDVESGAKEVVFKLSA